MPRITRRDFVTGSATTVIGLAMARPALASDRSTVVLIRDADALDERSAVNPEVIQQMLDKAVIELFGGNSPQDAFRTIISPDQTVGIKTNVWNHLPTPPEVENAIKRRVMDVGVPEEKIGIDDHTVRSNPIFQNADSIINVRPLRTHYLSGVSGCMKNLIMFSENQPKWHPNSCQDLGLLQTLPEVKGKLRLHVLCALTPQFHGRGAHHFSRRYVWKYKGLIVGTDAVAVDSVALQLLMAKRTEVLGASRALPPVPIHIERADKVHGLGNSDMANIDLVKLGWQEDILI
ncbi:MAG: DUF362 domain-containing protein [bacterium]|nr:DUF362 domain-containing protein [bacterium]